jgi:hypothetical protein
MDKRKNERMSLSQALADSRFFSLIMPTICVSLGLVGWVTRVRFGASISELLVLLSLAFAVVLVSVLLAVRRHQLGRNPFLTMTPSGNVDIRASRREIVASTPLTLAGLVSIYFFIVGRPTHVLAALAAGIVLWQVLRRLLR